MRSLCLLALIALAAWADDTVIVTGHGEAKVRPDRVEFRFAVSARERSRPTFSPRNGAAS